MFVLCIDILYRKIILKIWNWVYEDQLILPDFWRFGLHFDVIVNQNRDLLYNSNLIIVINFRAAAWGSGCAILQKQNYTELCFNGIKCSKISQPQGFWRCFDNQIVWCIKVFLHSYSLETGYYAAVNMKMIIILNFTPLGQ